MKELKLLKEALLKSASAETSCNPEAYRKRTVKSPLYLHCSPVALIVQAIYKGDIVTGKVNGVSHYWNRLPDGTEIDLTSCQFDGDGFSPLRKGRKVHRKLVPLRFLFFANIVKDNLK